MNSDFKLREYMQTDYFKDYNRFQNTIQIAKYLYEVGRDTWKVCFIRAGKMTEAERKAYLERIIVEE